MCGEQARSEIVLFSLFVLILSLPLTRKALDEVFDYGQR